MRQPVCDQEVTRDDEGESVQKVLISSDKLKDLHLRHHYKVEYVGGDRECTKHAELKSFYELRSFVSHYYGND